MSLTMGSGPLAARPAASNYSIDGPAHRILFEPHPRRIRAVLGGRTVVDTVRGHLLHESNILPVLYVPFDDLDAELLEPTDHTTHCPFKGDASYWTVRAGDRVAENAVWTYREPIESAAWLAGYVAAYWDAMDAWLEEDEQLTGRLRDPYHRVDVLRASARVTVRAGGEPIAASERPLLLFETGLPPRAYLPLDDVRRDLLVPSDKTTHCPYKGTASYWSVRTESGLLEDVAWSYADPIPESAVIAGLVSFLGDAIEVEIDRAGVR